MYQNCFSEKIMVIVQPTSAATPKMNFYYPMQKNHEQKCFTRYFCFICTQKHPIETGYILLTRNPNWFVWLSKAKKHFPISQKTIIRWIDEIIAYFDNGTTSGVVEGINNKLKLIKRSGYGFRNFENFRVRCLLHWSFIY